MPSPATLKKYGLSEYEYHYMLNVRQNGLCPICLTVPTRPVIDHIHVRGWKKMRPENRRKYVRGVCCWFCNRYYLAKGITAFKANNLAAYLKVFKANNLASYPKC